MARKIASRMRAGLAVALISAGALVIGAQPAAAASFTGGFSPTIYSSLADLNGDGVADGADDSTAFYGDTDIIDGGLDCDAWAADNDGAAGDGMIDANDDCTMIGYDGTANGVTIDVVDGEFATADAVAIADGTALPTVFNAGDPDNPGVGPSDFAWSAIGGRVDSNGDETIDGNECHFGIVGTADVLGSDVGCGFAGAIDPSLDGLVDLNSDEAIDDADICIDGCFFGLDVILGFVSDPDCTIIGTSGRDTLDGSPGADVICGLGGNDRIVGGGADDTLRGGAGNDRLVGRSGADLIKGGSGDDLMKGNRGRDRLFGDAGPDTALGGAGQDRCVSARVQRGCEL
jgi:Ca2+-binding RTX toxin-like protein